MLFDPFSPACGNTTSTPPVLATSNPTGRQTVGVSTHPLARKMGTPTRLGAAVIARNEVAFLMRQKPSRG